MERIKQCKERQDKTENENDEVQEFKTLMYGAVLALRNNQPVQIESLKNELQNVNEWFDKFERMTDQWSAEQRANKIPLYFEGTALSKWKRLSESEKIDYKTIKKEITQALRPGNRSARAKTHFYSARQEPGESVDEFACRLYEYREDWPIDEYTAFDKDITYRFKDGLNAEIGTLLELFNFKNFNELVSKGKQIERKLNSEKGDVSIESAIHERTKKVICFKCKKPGHWAKDCKIDNDIKEIKIPCIFCGKPDHFSIECEVFKLHTSSNAKEKVKATKADQTKCSHCKKDNHEVKDCRFLNKTCFKCGETGHQIKECTKNRP